MTTHRAHVGINYNYRGLSCLLPVIELQRWRKIYFKFFLMAIDLQTGALITCVVVIAFTRSRGNGVHRIDRLRHLMAWWWSLPCCWLYRLLFQHTWWHGQKWLAVKNRIRNIYPYSKAMTCGGYWASLLPHFYCLWAKAIYQFASAKTQIS